MVSNFTCPKTFWWRKCGVNEGNRIASNFTWSKSFQWRKSQTNLAPTAPNLCSFYLFSPLESITTLSGDEQSCSSDTFIRAALCQQNFHLIWYFHSSSGSLSSKLSSQSSCAQDGRVADQSEDDADGWGGGGGGGDRHLKAQGQKRGIKKKEH